MSTCHSVLCFNWVDSSNGFLCFFGHVFHGDLFRHEFIKDQMGLFVYCMWFFPDNITGPPSKKKKREKILGKRCFFLVIQRGESWIFPSASHHFHPSNNARHVTHVLDVKQLIAASSVTRCSLVVERQIYYMDVSKNSGTSKWMVYKGNPIIKMDDLGVPLFSETPI